MISLRKSALLVLLTVFSVSFLLGCNGNDEEAAASEGETQAQVEVIQARLASEEIEGDFMTVWAEYFGDYMAEQTDGVFQLDVYPYGTLGDNRDINELAQLGVVEFVFSDFAWISAFVPEAQVLSLHYIWPKERMPEVLEWVVNNGEFMPFLEDAFRANGLVPLGILYEGWQWITSDPPAVTLADLEGLRTRVMGSRLLVEDYRAYNMSPTPMDYGEVYSGLQTGLIDAQVNPLFANYSMKFYEVTNYFTQIWAEPFLGIPTINEAFFDSLPQDMQDHMMSYFKDNVLQAADWIDARNERDKASIEEERPDIVWTEWSQEEMDEARELAMTVWTDAYPEIAGPNSEEGLELLLQDIENAKAALGML